MFSKAKAPNCGRLSVTVGEHPTPEELVQFTRDSDDSQADYLGRRGKDVLKKLLRRYPDKKKRLRRAHKRLKGDANYAAAMDQAGLAFGIARYVSSSAMEKTRMLRLRAP